MDKDIKISVPYPIYYHPYVCYRGDNIYDSNKLILEIKNNCENFLFTLLNLL